MSEQWMIVRKESITSKIARFFKNLFGKKEYVTINDDETKAVEYTTKTDKEAFANSVKIDNTQEELMTKRMEFLKRVDGNEEELNKLSIEQLKKLQSYYQKIIEENDAKISKLKANT